MNSLASKKGTFAAVILIIMLFSYVAFFGLDIGSLHLKSASEMRFGIDIRGGIEAAFVPKDVGRKFTEAELEEARTVIETRLDQRNILDRDVTIDKDNNCIFVRFPWKSTETDFDPEKAIAELGSMALLQFKDPDGNIVIEGKHVEKAAPGLDQNNLPIVQLTLKPEGRQLFAEATAKFVGQKISIYLDDYLISDPVVQEKIDSETCSITGIRSTEEAKTLANQINSGALPFALITENYSTISPELGSNALNVMVLAGIVAFAVICLALIFYYRLSGLIAAFSLLFQITGQIILLTWPQFSITLPGIAGIILSIGMGVDANVIVSERIREELKSGKTLLAAVTSGFKMAFSSIFDGNITVLIVAVIMMSFGSGAILSFAYTLLFGIIMNFVAGVTATKLMTVSIAQFGWAKKASLFISKRALNREVKIFDFYKNRRIYYIISACIMIFGIIMTIINGVILDIQFKGGTVLKYTMSETIELDLGDVENLVSETLNGTVVTGQITTDFVSGEKRLVLSMAGNRAISNEELSKVTDVLREKFPEQDFELDSTNNVSPYFGKQFLKKAMIAIVLSAVCIILYVWYSFRRIHGLSAGAMSLVALLHDVLVAFFVFTIFRIPIGDSFVAVSLTILGYSINDTIVIYDRIRENFRKSSKGEQIEDIVNRSISQSLTRSINTNIAVFISIAILSVFAILNGLDSITSFALPMAIGSISGCYSTICIVGPLWTSWEKRRQEKLIALRGSKKKK